MGCGVSTANPEPPKQLVLLGGGECGKTTIFKQIQILHGTGFSDTTSLEWVPAIHRSPLRSMKVLLARLTEMGKLDAMTIDDQARVTRVSDAAESMTAVLTPALASDIAALWKHCVMAQILEEADSVKDSNGKESRLDLDDNAVFFFWIRWRRLRKQDLHHPTRKSSRCVIRHVL